MDWAFIQESTNKEIDGIDNEILGSSYAVQGHETQSGIEDLISGNDYVRKYGAGECYSSGNNVSEKTLTICGEESSTWIETSDASSESGDSGCPHYRKYDNYNINTIVGIHYGYDIVSTPAYKMNEHGIEFGGGSTC